MYPNSLEMGGSQMNAIDIAGALNARGHEVTVFGPPGELDARVAALGLTKADSPIARIHPSRAVTTALTEHVRSQRAQIVHAFEWPPAVEALYGPFRSSGVPVLCTIMSMAVAPFLPLQLPMTVGTREILRAERVAGRAVSLVEPPVDTETDRARDQRASKRSLGLPEESFVVVLVSRLAEQLKLEGVLAAITAVGVLHDEAPGSIHLVIAGDGAARATVEEAAARVNQRAERSVVMVLGQVADPRTVYDAADVALGMGGSALRAMAFSKTLIVQGERGFWRVLRPESLSDFLRTGWYGVGDGNDGVARLATQLRQLRTAPEQRAHLGEYSRTVVEQHYSLSRCAETVEARYAQVIADAEHARIPLIRAFGSITRYELARKIRRRLGGVALDDFNTIARMQQHNRASTQFVAAGER